MTDQDIFHKNIEYVANTPKCEVVGYLTLTAIPEKRREMQICLTQK